MSAGRNKRDVLEIGIIGDSLSDRGMLWDRKLLGIFPMADWSGLKGNSPDKRFTNGPVWADDFALLLFMKFKLKEMQDKGKGDGDGGLFKKLAKHYQEYLENPALLDTDQALLDFYKEHMENPEAIQWQNKEYVQSYSEGGVADNPALVFSPTPSFMIFMARLILNRLRNMRDLLLADDKKRDIDKSVKTKKLIIEWSGANDLITINDKPSYDAAEIAVHERIKNVKKLIKEGYQNFLLFDLPDLALTPRFSAENNQGDEEKTKNARECCMYFNDRLKEEVKALRKAYPQCKINVFDVSKKFKKIYDDCEKYHFDPEKKAQPLKSDDYQAPKPGEVLVPSKGHMFFDDVHPTAQMHYILSRKVYKYVNKNYNLVDPAAVDQQDVTTLEIDDDKLIRAFRDKYNKTFNRDLLRIFGEFSQSRINVDSPYLRLIDIFDHAINNGGKRTYKVLQKLGWLDKNGELYLDNVPALKRAYERATAPKQKFNL